QWLISGFGGYEKAISGFKKEIDRRFDKPRNFSKEKEYSFGWIKQKYPLHFLLFNLLSNNRRREDGASKK
ncbi:hypothetical protein KKA96_00870, partial [Patescibacteria group bacterium]|nr:hypothetical protein [Patescibacteria group bacterium]